jgi:hypothetical protein
MAAYTRASGVYVCVCVYARVCAEHTNGGVVFLIRPFTVQTIRTDKCGIYLDRSVCLPLRRGLLSQMCDTYTRG